MFSEEIAFIRSLYPGKDIIPLHEPCFTNREKELVGKCIDSTFVSSVGEHVSLFEDAMKSYTGARHAVAVTNGSIALHLILHITGVAGCEILTQPVSFIATSNAIIHAGADPVFIDIDKDTLGLSPGKLSDFLDKNAEVRADGFCYNKLTNKRIAACMPMHTFGLPCRISEIQKICEKYSIPVIEDAAESLGSSYQYKHTGTFGYAGVISFNGNKIITTGGGGMILTNNKEFSEKAKHLSTQAKVSHPYEFNHDGIGFNYRMPNINAALGLAQMEKLTVLLQKKREMSVSYNNFFKSRSVTFISEIPNAISNYWLNSILFDTRSNRDSFLEETNQNGIQCRPVWGLISDFEMYRKYYADNLENAYDLAPRIVCLPSSAYVS